MNDILQFILSIIGLLALYWVLAGQWKHNKLMREADLTELRRDVEESKKTDEKIKNNSKKV